MRDPFRPQGESADDLIGGDGPGPAPALSGMVDDPEPRWPALVALMALAGIYSALPGYLIPGPRWVPLAVVAVLLVPTVITHHRGAHDINHVLGHLVAAVVTVFLIWSLAWLVIALPTHKEAPASMLRSAVALWVSNVIVFGLWYWRLDAGGPHARDLRATHCRGAFLFPQMTISPGQSGYDAAWSPHFIDYLFLAFNTSTALSPADTAILSRWAKILMMLQAAISLTVIALLAARAVNIL
jgi:branched-subunit amino acid transport protein